MRLYKKFILAFLLKFASWSKAQFKVLRVAQVLMLALRSRGEFKVLRVAQVLMLALRSRGEFKVLRVAQVLILVLVLGLFATNTVQARNEYLLNHKEAKVLLATPETEIGNYEQSVDVITIGQKEIRLQGYNPSQLN